MLRKARFPMKIRMARFMALGLVLALWSGFASAAEEKTLLGEYLWDANSSRGDLEATFTPDGKGNWRVVFNATVGGEVYIYQGTAKGSLADGGLKGEVTSESRRQTYLFKGATRKGEFQGTHSQMSGGSEQVLGTLTFGAK